MSRTFSITGLNHLGIVVEDISLARHWFIETLGLKLIEDRGELFFFLAGADVLAVKTPRMAVNKPEHGAESSYQNKAGFQHLDHYGFYAQSPEEVDGFTAFLETNNIEILKGPYDRRDGLSVYFRDPLGLIGEYLYFKPD